MRRNNNLLSISRGMVNRSAITTVAKVSHYIKYLYKRDNLTQFSSSLASTNTQFSITCPPLRLLDVQSRQVLVSIG